MIEQLAPPSWGASLFEAILARRLLELRRVQFVVDAHPHGDARTTVGPEPAAEPEPDPDPNTEFESDERLPQLGRFRELLEAGADRLAAARAAQWEQRRQAAVQVRELARFAALRPAGALDRPDEEVGSAAAASRAARPTALTTVSEWAVDEVMLALGLSSPAATALLAESIVLAERLPATVTALEEGRIGWQHAQAMAEIVGPVKDEVRAEVEARLLTRAEGKTVSQFKVAARRAVMRADAAAHTRRLAAAIRDRSVRAHPGRDGMGTLAATMPIPLLEACKSKLRAYAEECAVPGDQRTLDQRMLDCLADLILRPGETDLPPVQAQLTIVATAATLAGGDQPGEVNGQPVSAMEIRELAYALGLLPRPEDPAPPSTDQPDETTAATEPQRDGAAATEFDVESEFDVGSEFDMESDSESGPAVVEAAPEPPAGARPLSLNPAAMTAIGRLLALRSPAGTALADIPQIAIVDEISGQLLALTNATQIRHTATCGHRACRTAKRPCTHPPAGPGLGPPPPTSGYSPSDPLARFVRVRDRRCRFPGCRAAAMRCDLDHNRRWPDGSTSADNLCCLCRHHHRLSHQAPGWTMTRLPDGGLQWTTPGGQTITTRPIGYGTDDDLPPPGPVPEPKLENSEHAPMSTLERLRNWPSPRDPNEDPAPF
jgi:hypothetical protein